MISVRYVCEPLLDYLDDRKNPYQFRESIVYIHDPSKFKQLISNLTFPTWYEFESIYRFGTSRIRDAEFIETMNQLANPLTKSNVSYSNTVHLFEGLTKECLSGVFDNRRSSCVFSIFLFFFCFIFQKKKNEGNIPGTFTKK